MDGSTDRLGGTSNVVLQNYKLGTVLGIGSFGKVKMATHVQTGHTVAIKIINRLKIKNMKMGEKVWQEINILRLLMHPHIIRLYEVLYTQESLYLVMEYAKLGELYDYIQMKGKLSEDEACKFLQQILSGVEYCHRNMVIHRDLKPENILLDSKYNVKIADFGLSNILRNGDVLKTSCGSPNYFAPEVISGKPYVGTKVDVWSCGVILYALLCGILPFDNENYSIMYKDIKAGNYKLPSHLSDGARDLLRRILMVDPMKRLSIPEIRQHPWFQAHVPPYFALPPLDTLQQAKMIDEDILQQVTRMGCDRNQLVEFIHTGVQNAATVAYYLLLDNRFQGTPGYVGAELQESMNSSFTHLHPSEAPAPSVVHHHLGYMDMDHQGQGVNLTPQHPVERNLILGLQTGNFTHVHPSEAPLSVGHHRLGYMDHQEIGSTPQFPVERNLPLGLQLRLGW